MKVDKPILRQNTVAVFQDQADFRAYLAYLEELQSKEASVLHVSVAQCEGSKDSLQVVRKILEIVAQRGNVKWFDLIRWFRYKRINIDYDEIMLKVQRVKDLNEIMTFLAHNRRGILSQIELILRLEKKEYALFVISDFKQINSDDQPVLAGILHRLTKGTTVYLRIVATRELHLFQKDGFSEVGIQRGHDYVEYSSNASFF